MCLQAIPGYNKEYQVPKARVLLGTGWHCYIKYGYGLHEDKRLRAFTFFSTGHSMHLLPPSIAIPLTKSPKLIYSFNIDICSLSLALHIFPQYLASMLLMLLSWCLNYQEAWTTANFNPQGDMCMTVTDYMKSNEWQMDTREGNWVNQSTPKYTKVKWSHSLFKGWGKWKSFSEIKRGTTYLM